MDFLTEFPEMGRQDLRDFKKGIDASFKEFSRTYGDALESFFEPLLWLAGARPSLRPPMSFGIRLGRRDVKRALR